MIDAVLIEMVRRMLEVQHQFFAVRRQPGAHIEALETSRRSDHQLDKALTARARKQEALV